MAAVSSVSCVCRSKPLDAGRRASTGGSKNAQMASGDCHCLPFLRLENKEPAIAKHHGLPPNHPTPLPPPPPPTSAIGTTTRNSTKFTQRFLSLLL